MKVTRTMEAAVEFQEGCQTGPRRRSAMLTETAAPKSPLQAPSKWEFPTIGGPKVNPNIP